MASIQHKFIKERIEFFDQNYGLTALENYFFYGVKNALYVKLKMLKHLNSKVRSVTSIFITAMQLVCED